MMNRLLNSLLVGLWSCGAALAADDLAAGFAVPPMDARPPTWWRFINGNITREGITRDLTEMARQGYNSVDIFDVRGEVPPGNVAMLSPEWRQMFKHAVSEAARLGMKVRLVAAAGWGTGGPWLGEEHASKTLRWTEIQVEGPQEVQCLLPQASELASFIPPLTNSTYYRDVVLLAIRERTPKPVPPLRIKASSVFGYGDQDAKNWPPEDAIDGDPLTSWRPAAAPSPDKPAWIELQFNQPIAAEALFVAGASNSGPRSCQIMVSADGKNFRPVGDFELSEGESRRVQFAKTDARAVRLVVTSAYSPEVGLAEIQVLRAGDQPFLRPGIKWWWWKSGNRAFWEDALRIGTNGPAILADQYQVEDGWSDCRPDEVLDLTSRLAPDGTLKWKVPPGRWTLLRFGAILLGEGPRWMSDLLHGGYEADCYSRAAADAIYDHTAAILAKDVAPLTGKVFSGLFLDSYEIGASVKGFQGTWTDGFRKEFQRRRGYDPLPYLPAMAGRIVDGRQTTDRFLFDYRQTLADLYSEFYGRLTQRAHQAGLEFRAESGYGSFPLPHIDGLGAFGRVDVPMGEYWFRRIEFTQHYAYADPVRTAASAAHTYGRPLAAAESLTIADGRRQAPSEWKTHLDWQFCNGMNQFVANCWSLQFDVQAEPGVHTYDLMNENDTWWEQGRAFLQYLGRCNYLLQQGLPVADAAYFVGQGSATFVPARDFVRPELPAGYEFDGINAEVILERLGVKDGRLVLPEGTTYRYLVLPSLAGWRVTPQVLRKMQKLVQSGATIVGEAPAGTPGLTGYPKAENEVKRIAGTLWGAGKESVHKIGRGRVVTGKTMADLLALDGVKPDLDLSGMPSTREIRWCHRQSRGTEIYFLSNQAAETQKGIAVFRVDGKQPEFWNPLTGETRKAAAYSCNEGRTSIPIELAPAGSLFVVFRDPATTPRAEGQNFPDLEPLMTISGPWTVQFDPKRGGPERPVHFERLDDWTHRTEEEIRDYSGTAVYRKTFGLPKVAPKPGASVYLDLGSVKNLARVRLNGVEVGIVWTAPWHVDVTRALKPEGNRLEIEVVNLWSNRLVADEKLSPEKRVSRSLSPITFKDAPPLPSGLLGPVTLQQVR